MVLLVSFGQISGVVKYWKLQCHSSFHMLRTRVFPCSKHVKPSLSKISSICLCQLRPINSFRLWNWKFSSAISPGARFLDLYLEYKYFLFKKGLCTFKWKTADSPSLLLALESLQSKQKESLLLASHERSIKYKKSATTENSVLG